MQSWGPCEELLADLWLHEEHWWSSYASPQVHNDENGSISASLGKYSTKHCKVVASMSSLAFLGCSKVVTSTHENVVKTQNVWGILSDNLVHLILIPLHSANKRPLHHAPALFTLHQGASASFPSSKMAWSNWKNSPQGAMPMVLLDRMIFVDVRQTEPTS